MNKATAKGVMGQQLSMFGMKPTKFQLELPKTANKELREITTPPKESIYYE